MNTNFSTKGFRAAIIIVAFMGFASFGFAQSVSDFLDQHDPSDQIELRPAAPVREPALGGGAVNGSGVRIRAWAPDGTVIATAVQWSNVEILSREGDWLKVRYNGKTGYIASRFVTPNSMPPYIESEKMTPEAFFAKLAPMCKKSMKETGVPCSVTMAQAALECGWASNYLAYKANNLFSIKGKGPAGSVTIVCDEYYNGKHVYEWGEFRKYNSWEESVCDHANFLKNNKRYAAAFKYTGANLNANKFASAIHQAGYATDPNYTSLLCDMMKRYNLYQYDK